MAGGEATGAGHTTSVGGINRVILEDLLVSLLSVQGLCKTLQAQRSLLHLPAGFIESMCSVTEHLLADSSPRRVCNAVFTSSDPALSCSLALTRRNVCAAPPLEVPGKIKSQHSLPQWGRITSVHPG
jgi:hypothetical protein